MRLILSVLLSLTSTIALAQAPSTSVIPYSGTLFSQGKPVSQSAPVQMAFALYTDITGLDAGQTDAAPAANRVWSSWGAGDVVGSDQTIPVQVRNGRFLVHLGDAEQGQETITHPLFTSGQLHVVSWVTQPNEEGELMVFRLPAQALATVPYSIKAHNGVPPGSVQIYMGSSLPTGWLWCDGGSYATSDYPYLAAALGSSAATFNVPDLRGRFVRGLNDMDGGGSSPAATAGDSHDQDNRTIGSFQGHAFDRHRHGASGLGGTANSSGNHRHNIITYYDGGNNMPSYKVTGDDGAWERRIITVPSEYAGNHTHSLNITGNTSYSSSVNETRPVNVAVRYIIKY